MSCEPFLQVRCDVNVPHLSGTTFETILFHTYSSAGCWPPPGHHAAVKPFPGFDRRGDSFSQPLGPCCCSGAGAPLADTFASVVPFRKPSPTNTRATSLDLLCSEMHNLAPCRSPVQREPVVPDPFAEVSSFWNRT